MSLASLPDQTDATVAARPLRRAVGQSSRFVALAPARVLDTRNGTGGTAGPLAPGSAITVQVGGVGGVPGSGVTAVAFNLTVTDTAAAGYVTAWPAGDAQPTASNINATAAGQTVPNLVIVTMPPSGVVSLFTQAGGHLIADVAGYWVAASAATSGRLVTLAPTRVLDTRDGTGAPGPLGPDQTIEVQLAGRGGVPTRGAAAVVLNVTATETAAAGYVTVWPTGRTRPQASVLNAPDTGSTVPNLVIVPIGRHGTVSFYSQAGTHLVADVAGYFTNGFGANTTTGLFVPVTPQRVLDSRNGQPVGRFWPSQRRDIPVAGIGDVPGPGVGAAILNITGTEAAGAGYVTAYPAATVLPNASNLNLDGPGATRANLALVPLGIQGRVSLFSQSGTQLIADVSGYFVGATVAPSPGVPLVAPPPPAPPVIPPPLLASRSTCTNYGGFGFDTRIDVNPGLATLLAPIDWRAVDLATVQYLAATFMWNSGPLAAYVGSRTDFNDWMASQYSEHSPASRSALLFSAWLATAYHETIHVLQAGCLVSSASTGYLAPRLGPSQSVILGDVRARINLYAPPGTASSYCRGGALAAADLYLDPVNGLADQGLESQLWEINAYVLELEFEVGLSAAIGEYLPGDPLNLSIISAKLHQLARYLEASRSTWTAMRSRGVAVTVADQWNLAVRWWRPRNPVANSRPCWDLAFGPDSMVIAEFTGGLAGTVAPPRP